MHALRLITMAGIVLLPWCQPAQAINGFLQTLVQTPGGVVIVYGTGAKSLEAANTIKSAINLVPGQATWNNLRTAAAFDADTMSITGQSHVIAVGTMADNIVLRERHQLPTWYLDRDWYYTQYQYAVSPGKIGLPYQPVSGFIAGGFGEWAKGVNVGYVEVDRSKFFMEWMVRGRWERATWPAGGAYKSQGFFDLWQVTTPTYPTEFPLRLIVRVTGGGTDGVVEAARAFAERNMLNGVVLGSGAVADNGPALFTLTTARYATTLPFTPPDNISGYLYQGWLLADAFQYDGFKRETAVTPIMMYRIKYKPPFGITNFWTSPHRRASQFEVCAIKCASNSDATTARTALLNKATANARIKGLNAVVVGSVLYVESMPEPAGAALLAACAALASW